MQLYRSEFHAKKGEVVKTGTYLVCASSAEMAEATLGHFLELPANAVFKTARVKPSIYELASSEFRPRPSTCSGRDEDGAVHEIRASAKVFAYSENTAIKRFANAAIEHASAHKSHLPKHVDEFLIEIERADHRPRPSRIEEQSIYKEKRFFAGGAARPR